MKKMLFDTNIFVRIFQGEKQEQRLFLQAMKQKTLLLSPIVIAELHASSITELGERIDEVAQYVLVLDITQDIARLAGELKRKRTLKQIKTYLPDCLLAATALTQNSVFVTHNQKDFQFVGLQTLVP